LVALITCFLFSFTLLIDLNTSIHWISIFLAVLMGIVTGFKLTVFRLEAYYKLLDLRVKPFSLGPLNFYYESCGSEISTLE
jgi:hypothetical protein